MADVGQLETKLSQGGLVILDGANGTELERLGATMDHGVWCAKALADHPDIVRDVHRRYIDAGADVITTNTFSATREALQRYGLGEQFESWNRLGVQFALEERDKSSPDREIYVAGSVSTYGQFSRLDVQTMADHFRAQGQLLVESGVDLLILETLGSTLEVVKTMIAATSDLGVPVWVSISCLKSRTTGTMMFGIEESEETSYASEEYAPFDEAVRQVMSAGGSALLMMHSDRQVTESAVAVMRENYSGPIGAYPNAGYWARPNWTFVDQVSPADYLADAKNWVAAGASIVGGCCGIGVEHIRALHEGLRAG